MTDSVVVASWQEIEATLGDVDAVAEMEAAFVAYSDGLCVVPPVGELRFDDPPGDVHIKYGYVQGDELYVVKIASGFARNPDLGLPTGDGMMVLFRQATGEPAALLLDRGHLTDLRTAAAGAVCARHLAPPRVSRIGILGTGVQARAQLRHLQGVVDCKRVLAWGRRPEACEAYAQEMRAEGYEVDTAAEPAEIAASCELIVTATAATEPLLRAADVRPGTHITAMGSDTPDKQELEAQILASPAAVVVDSIPQSRERGEVARAVHAGALTESDVVELGDVVAGRAPGRETPEQVTIADLTGVAVQDVRIASAALRALS